MNIAKVHGAVSMRQAVYLQTGADANYAGLIIRVTQPTYKPAHHFEQFTAACNTQLLMLRDLHVLHIVPNCTLPQADVHVQFKRYCTLTYSVQCQGCWVRPQPQGCAMSQWSPKPQGPCHEYSRRL